MYIYIYYVYIRSTLDAGNLQANRRHIISGSEVSVLQRNAELCWVHDQQREDSHTAERKKWLRSSRHHLGFATWKDSWEDQTTRDTTFSRRKTVGKTSFFTGLSDMGQIWKLGNVFQFGRFWKNNDAEPMNLGVSLFSTKPRCSTSHHGTFEFTECGPLYNELTLWILRLPTTSCQPRAAHFSSYSPFSTWFPSLGRFESV